MKFSTVILAVGTFATAVYGQLDAFPNCAQSCLLTGVQASGCSLTDFKCACTAQPFFDKSLPCIQSSCSTADQDKARTAALGLCKSVGIDITDKLPPPSGGGSTTTSAPPTGPTGGSPCKPKLRFRRY
ncbi:hypothetical protein H072_11528 [Dactylellina haptotyla CBS 200.50]|uniref:CFEM domain-containing protein n=1 Tax=Dactylellina haptotyla (strain CBS 200.50) TaxID=1284197 RepID=S8B7T1_DACHA|nr:hypothetical protein H072_11528 [Dactylellina haptotyla CBS 200.50]